MLKKQLKAAINLACYATDRKPYENAARNRPEGTVDRRRLLLGSFELIPRGNDLRPLGMFHLLMQPCLFMRMRLGEAGDQ